jgi:hypothetical protein
MMMQRERERERENALFVTTVSCTFCSFHEKFQKNSAFLFLNFFFSSVCVFFVDETDLPVFSL